MNNIEIYVVAEGKTEQTFISEVLAPYMALGGLYLHSPEIGISGHKGGNINIERAKTNIGTYLRQRRDVFVSTMFDFFKIDSKWPGKEEVDIQLHQGINLSVSQKAEIIEQATLKEVMRSFPDIEVKRRFIPYISMHEFEALLFSDVKVLSEKINIDMSVISRIVDEYNSPEEINEDPQKAPSKRLQTLASRYKKIIMGKAISEAIGIDMIRKKCAHFNEWLVKLEKIAK
jgi:hypothetical protein